MWKYTLQITGMACGMCEAHIRDVLRRTFPARRVSASRRKGEAVLFSARPLAEQALQAAIARAGYAVTGIVRENQPPKGLLGRWF